MAIKNKISILAVIILVTVEQVIKIIISNNFLNVKLPIIPPLLYFEPVFNRDYSWINSMLKLGIGKWVHISVVSMMIILIYLFYKYLNERFGKNKTIDSMFAFLFSGAMCS